MRNLKEESFKIKSSKERDAMSWYQDYKEKENDKVLIGASDDEFSSYDNWIASGRTEFLTETKVRTNYDAFKIDNYGGPILEFDKLSGIIKYIEDNEYQNVPFLYFNFFRDELRIYNIDLDPTMHSWYLKKLQQNDFDKNKIWKHVVNLQKSSLIETINYK